MRFAIYARYSSVRQSDTSIDDQIRMCQEYAIGQGGSIEAIFADHAISGAHDDRPGLNDLVAAAQTGRFQIVVAEALDRLSRDQENIAGLFKRLRHCGIEIHTLSEGQITELHIGLKGTMNALFLKDLAAKTKRGQIGAVERGRIPGGLSYGYVASRDQVDHQGEPIRGIRTINAEEAAIIRRIFTEYAAGKSPKAIAIALNNEGVKSPRGKGWRASAIYGSARRGNGILHNRLYTGQIVYNRQSFVKDPDTGKKKARPNPEHEWVIQDAPELRIIDDALWDAAHQRMRSIASGPDKKRPKRLLSGLIKCAACGASYVGRGRNRMACSAHIEKGTCDNRIHLNVEAIEQRVLSALRSVMLDRELLGIYVEEYAAEMRRIQSTVSWQRATLEAQLTRTNDDIEKAVEAIIASPKLSSLHEKLAALEADKQSIEAQLAAVIDLPAIPLGNALASTYRQKVDTLMELVDQGTTDGLTAKSAIRGMISSVRIQKNKAADGQAVVELVGDLAAILAFANGTPETLGNHMEAMVAGAGFEPATFRL